MKTFPLGSSDLQVPAVVAGMMRIQESTDAEIRTFYDTCRELGIDFFDHADIYGKGAAHGCELRFSEALQLSAAEREQIVLQTKAGIVKDGPYFDFSYEHIIEAVDGSLAALRTEYIDILLLHRPDALVEPEEVARAFDELAAAGKVRQFGVSNQTPGQIDLLRRYVTQPLVANQVQISITHSPMIAQGIAMNMAESDQSVDRTLGTLDYCRLHDITVQAWSPFQAGFFNGPFLGNRGYPELNAVIDRLAATYGVEPEAIAVAWITRHPANIQVVLGTTSPARIRAAAAGADLVLTRPEWYELFRTAGHIVP